MDVHARVEGGARSQEKNFRDRSALLLQVCRGVSRFSEHWLQGQPPPRTSRVISGPGAQLSMHLDVIDLRQFYYRTRLGRVAQLSIRGQLSQIWPDANWPDRCWIRICSASFAAVPVPRRGGLSGLCRAPKVSCTGQPGMPNVSVLCSELTWPIETGAADKLLVLHGLETSENPTALLQECWRVLAPGGRVVIRRSEPRRPLGPSGSDAVRIWQTIQPWAARIAA